MIEHKKIFVTGSSETVSPGEWSGRKRERIASGADYRECARCILTTEDRACLEFDSEGICNHCRAFDRMWEALPLPGADRQLAFESIVRRTRHAGRDRDYDCILGISGGIDSAFLALLAKRAGLRPLVVHFDNGWNSELAVKNIESIVETLGFDLHTYVIDWDEFRELQLAYLRASVIDIEVLTDHAIYGSLFALAIQKKIPFVLSGNNVATEGVLPYSWTFNKLDHVNIQDIHRRFGKGTIRSYPFVDARMKRRIRRSGIEVVTLLDYVPYIKADVKRELQTEFGWRDYGGKHYESIFTRFYQGYILPTKFGIDKRKAHLSSLICSRQMTRNEALLALEEPAYDAEQLRIDREYVLKKLRLSSEEFEAMMEAPIRAHREFEVGGSFFHRYPLLRPLRPLWLGFKRVRGISLSPPGAPPRPHRGDLT